MVIFITISLILSNTLGWSGEVDPLDWSGFAMDGEIRSAAGLGF